MAPVHGEGRRDSIGSFEAYRELQEVSSVHLMRDSILKSISSSTYDSQNRYGRREEISNPSQPNIEVKFLEKRCPSLSSPKSSSEETIREESKSPESILKTETQENKESSKNPPFPDFEVSGSFEESYELLHRNADKEITMNSNESNYDNASKLKSSSKNSLKLAIRNKNDNIFEDCSTYNISCPDASPELKSNEIFTNSLDGTYSNVPFSDIENSSETNYSYSSNSSEFVLSSPSINSPDSPDVQTSLCDTFFTQLANSESGPLPKQQSPHLSQVKRKSSITKKQGGNCQIPNEEGMKKSEEILDVHQSGQRSSKKIRRRHRKNHSNDPVVYECPKCGVSYVIESKMSNDGVCFHCDMWTSVEPEFVKREKLLTWNTCRIC